MTTGRINQVTPCSGVRSTGRLHQTPQPSRTSIFRLHHNGDGTAQTNAQQGIRVALQKAYHNEGSPHCFTAFATLWHSFTCLHGANNNNDDVVSMVHQFATLGTTTRSLLPTLTGQNSHNFPFAATSLAGTSPSLGPIAVLGRRTGHHTKQHRTGSKAECPGQFYISSSRQFLVPIFPCPNSG